MGIYRPNGALVYCNQISEGSSGGIFTRLGFEIFKNIIMPSLIHEFIRKCRNQSLKGIAVYEYCVIPITGREWHTELSYFINPFEIFVFRPFNHQGFETRACILAYVCIHYSLPFLIREKVMQTVSLEIVAFKSWAIWHLLSEYFDNLDRTSTRSRFDYTQSMIYLHNRFNLPFLNRSAITFR